VVARKFAPENRARMISTIAAILLLLAMLLIPFVLWLIWC
jgi:hypothetical protein